MHKAFIIVWCPTSIFAETEKTEDIEGWGEIKSQRGRDKNRDRQRMFVTVFAKYQTKALCYAFYKD